MKFLESLKPDTLPVPGFKLYLPVYKSTNVSSNRLATSPDEDHAEHVSWLVVDARNSQPASVLSIRSMDGAGDI
jgi:hypothetical protein